jgi:transaldolase|tara:strand:+ start:83 stop:736 length:654 start_codon:yes stop_codon:yes gene_type:complete
MKIFLDTADVSTILNHFETGLIDGVTTNPTLIRKSGRDPEDVYLELAEAGVRDISMEVVGSREEMTSEGRRLASKFQEVATIKVPCTPDGLYTCNQLAKDGTKVNVTLIFDAAQAILAAKAGATYVSPFVGRLDDNSVNGLDVIKDISEIYQRHWIKTEILSASIRGVKAVSTSFALGANVVTMPPNVFEKMYNHVLTDKGLELFDADWASVVAQTK